MWRTIEGEIRIFVSHKFVGVGLVNHLGVCFNVMNLVLGETT